MNNAEQVATVDTVLDLLRQLPPRERLKVLVQALPEIEQELAVHPGPLKSLHGLWKGLVEAENGQEREPRLDPAQDPLLEYVGKVSNGSLAQGIDKELYDGQSPP